MKDPYGAVLVLLRDDPAVAAIVGSKVSAVAEAPPSVRLRALATSLRPFGPNSGHLGLQLWAGAAQCYGDLSETGPILARSLAGAVVDALHGRRSIRGSTYLLDVWTPDIGEMLRDPVTDWPYHTVRIEVHAARDAQP